MTDQHAFLAPSAAHRWVQCPASPKMEALHPEPEDSPESMEGTAAHWVNQMTLAGTPPAIDSATPNGVIVTGEMLEGAELVVEAVDQMLGAAGRAYLVVEQRVAIPRVHAQNWGTPDYRAWTRAPDNRLVLNMLDYKFGHGIVEAFENWQLIDYVAGCLSEAGITGLADQNVIVDMCVIQPRSFHKDGPVRHWRVLASDLRGHINRLAMAAEDATSADPGCSPAPAACKHCLARHACTALQRTAYMASDLAYKAESLDMTPQHLGLELRMLYRARDLLNARISGQEAQAVSHITVGKRQVPWWAMEATSGRRGWIRPAAEVIALGNLMGVNLAKDPDVITPTQARKAGLLDSLVDAYSHVPPGTAKLVPDDGAKARRVFTKEV